MVKGVGINADSSTIDGNLNVLEGMLAFFEQKGFDYVEIPVHGVDCIVNGELMTPRLEKVKRILKSFGLKYTVHAPDNLNLADTDNESLYMKAMESTIKFASEIGAEIVVYHSSYGNTNMESFIKAMTKRYRTDKLDEIKKKLQQEETKKLQLLAEYAVKCGVLIAVENHFLGNPATYSYGNYPDTLVDMIKSVGFKNVGICYDFGHGYISSKKYGFEFVKAVEMVEPYIIHIHIHDNFGKMDAREKNIERIFTGKGDLHLPVGWGDIPYDEIFEIVARRYEGVLMLELQPRFKDCIEDVISVMKGYMKKYFRIEKKID
ncbi:sugar phosphate isomerase/epimerase [Biomaibacter acetigenes]|jgi:sugar phosphate isomerase/epimerase|uniref:Sugar phosphate isomerase/epimerase n=1 Tax=Biomaibacter acetigenes TaxID=2316383 RepID=A0A3G2R4P0_9FIRM|nr:sugar phosphate isomerase/epimerase [Biomaibacter acetigenes]AYO30088.1 sugar phosphate isomerase/epimerase [Biomaibacter acetigenes]MDN5301189.1 hypothetical protein [Thermoanaerobacteraceae bacterium]